MYPVLTGFIWAEARGNAIWIDVMTVDVDTCIDMFPVLAVP